MGWSPRCTRCVWRSSQTSPARRVVCRLIPRRRRIAFIRASNTGSVKFIVFKTTIKVTPTSGVPGTGLTVTGTGWPAGDAIFVQIGSTAFDTDVACVLTVAADGTIAGNKPGSGCQVPNVPTGNQPLYAVDDQHPGVAAKGAVFKVT